MAESERIVSAPVMPGVTDVRAVPLATLASAPSGVSRLVLPPEDRQLPVCAFASSI